MANKQVTNMNCWTTGSGLLTAGLLVVAAGCAGLGTPQTPSTWPATQGAPVQSAPVQSAPVQSATVQRPAVPDADAPSTRHAAAREPVGVSG